ncbi:het-E-1 heterokaryon incompatibility protein [Fusarium denticulatum]|uniref:Het-E-1 heterokaryon incompatibility protein n=1 Tax=Fusarium denticulatum TaxID=48507 RepID=A0A8H5XGD5_9HYPO|nr:het-E-1 heterokaryon incompatibility protein [Fusarium denticulatum]
MNDYHIGKAANAGNVKINAQTNHIYGKDEEKDSCLKDLYITNPEADKKRIEREKGGLLEGCYNWILYNDNFLQWRDDPEQHLLWIRGDPGKGKTMLLAGLITELEKTLDGGIFYFFCQATRPSHRTASNVLRGIIWLFISRRPSLSSYVRREYDQAGSNIFTDHNAWYALSGILTAILEDETSTDCIIIIDALDECAEGRGKLIGYISQCSISSKAKWNQVRLHLELNHASIANAVLKFVDHKVNQLNSTYDDPTRARIHKHLLENANDTFLWVALMILDISDRDMEWCRAILAVIAVALRPLSLQELAAADGALIQWVEDKETLESLVTSCGSLLTIRGDTVYTVHQSVNDFLRTTTKILPSDISLQHYSIFDCSMNVMRDRLHRNLYKLQESCVSIDEIDILESSPLTIVGYACVFWIDHFYVWFPKDNRQKSNVCYTTIIHFFENKYLYWLEAMSLLRCTSEAIKAMQRLEHMLDGGVSGELRVLVQDAVRFASTHRTIMDAAPLQLYDSALIFTPHLNRIKGCFNQDINQSIDVLSPDFQQWDACILTIPGMTSNVHEKAKCGFSPDGQQIAAINSNNDSILLTDASTGGFIKSIDSPGGKDAFTFHPRGNSLVTISYSYIGCSYMEVKTRLSIFHLPNGEYNRSFFVEASWRRTPLFSPDGQLLALPSSNYSVDIWNIASETKMASFRVGIGDVKHVFWIYIPSHPHALLILGAGEISIWSFHGTHQTSELMSLTSNVYPCAAAINSDRTCCAVWQDGKELVLYSWRSSIRAQIIARFDRGKDVYCASFVADDRSIALCGTFGIELWDLEEKRLVTQVTGESTNKICYGRNRQLASFGYRDGTLKIWSLDAILNNSEPTAQQSASLFKAFIRTPSGKVAVISDKAQSDMLNMAVKGRFHQLPKSPPNSPPGSFYRAESLAFGHGDYFAVATNSGAVDIFNREHDTGFYYCERRIGEHVVPECAPYNLLTIEFWGLEQIITCSNYIRFWDLKTGKHLRMVSPPPRYGVRRSNVTADGRIALGNSSSEVVVWDILCGKATQCFDLRLLRPDGVIISRLSLASSGILAISGKSWDQRFIAIGNAKDGSWIRKYSLPNDVPTLNFLTPKLELDTGLGVLKYDMEHRSSGHIPTVDAEDHWDPRYLRLFYSESEAWLMRVEINDAMFCQEHLAEICEDCSVDLRDENDGFYGFDTIDRDAIETPDASANQDGVYVCNKHNSGTCSGCFGWKKQILRARAAAKKAGRH